MKNSLQEQRSQFVQGSRNGISLIQRYLSRDLKGMRGGTMQISKEEDSTQRELYV